MAEAPYLFIDNIISAWYLLYPQKSFSYFMRHTDSPTETKEYKAAQELQRYYKDKYDDEVQAFLLNHPLDGQQLIEARKRMYDTTSVLDRQAKGEEDICIACCHHRSICRYSPCGHNVMCDTCHGAHRVVSNKCPMCRGDIKRVDLCFS